MLQEVLLLTDENGPGLVHFFSLELLGVAARSKIKPEEKGGGGAHGSPPPVYARGEERGIR